MCQTTKTSPRCSGHLLVAVVILAVVSCAEITDFVSVNTLADGEVETRVFYKGIFGKETTVGKGITGGVRLRQMTNNYHFIQMIYDEDHQLQDCEYGHQKDQVKSFLHSFKSDLKRLMDTSNVSVESLDGKALPEEFSWMNYTKLRRQCHIKHLEIKRALEIFTHNYTKSGDNKRSKRDISELLRVPGTHWCGKGYSADKYTRLGGFSRTDKCCRKHDLSCPFWIGAFETKYGLFNFRMNTIMHCNCDERFRTCLRMVKSSDANLVGKLFFNVVQTNCFVLKPKKKCVRSSWWGKCEKHKVVKQAILRDNLPY